METVPRLEANQAAIIEFTGRDPLRLVVEAVQGERVTLSVEEGGRLPAGLGSAGMVRMTYLHRYGVYTLEVPVESVGATTLVVGVPARVDRIQRRSYVRVDHPVDAACLLHDPDRNSFTSFDADVVDIGGGGIGLAANVIAPVGATVVMSVGIPGGSPVVAVGNVLAGEEPRVRADRRRMRVQYTLIREPDRDRIMAFIFTTLREGDGG